MGMTKEQMSMHIVNLYGENSEQIKSFEKLCNDCYNTEMWPLVEVAYEVLMDR